MLKINVFYNPCVLLLLQRKIHTNLLLYLDTKIGVSEETTVNNSNENHTEEQSNLISEKVKKRKRKDCDVLWPEHERLAFFRKHGISTSAMATLKKNRKISYITVREKIEVLEEIGLKPTMKDLNNFKTISETPAKQLVALGRLEHEDIATNVTLHLEPFPYEPEMRMPSIEGIASVYKPVKQYHRRKPKDRDFIKDWPNYVGEEKGKTMLTEVRRVLRQYYMWRLNTDPYTVDMHMFNYSTLMCFRSVRSIKRTFDILENDFELSKNKILGNFYLISILPERLQDLLDNVQTLGGTSLKEVADEVPKILGKTSESLLEVENLLKEFGIPESTRYYRYQTYTLTPETIKYRLESIQNSELAVYKSHFRIYLLIFYYVRAKRRLEILQQANLKCGSFNILVGAEKGFISYMNDAVDTSAVGNDIVTYLRTALQAPKTEIARLIGRHPARLYTPILEVQNTVRGLQDAGFSNEVILDSLCICLYPKDKIFEILETLKDNEELKKFGFEGGFLSAVSSCFTSGSKLHDKRLHLCLYYLEKPHNFTGDGAIRIPPAQTENTS